MRMSNLGGFDLVELVVMCSLGFEATNQLGSLSQAVNHAKTMINPHRTDASPDGYIHSGRASLTHQ